MKCVLWICNKMEFILDGEEEIIFPDFLFFSKDAESFLLFFFFFFLIFSIFWFLMNFWKINFLFPILYNFHFITNSQTHISHLMHDFPNFYFVKKKKKLNLLPFIFEFSHFLINFCEIKNLIFEWKWGKLC